MSRISYFFQTIFLFYALDIELETGCELFGTRSLPFHLIEILEIVEGKHVSLFVESWQIQFCWACFNPDGPHW
jgi:hypothetical protein